MSRGLGIVRPPAPRGDLQAHVPEIEDSLEVKEADKILSPISDYVPLLDEAKSKTGDPICHELASECDRLRVLIEEAFRQRGRKPGDIAVLVTRRVSALKSYASRLDEVEGKERVKVELAAVTYVVGIVKEIMRETGVSPEQREMVFQKLVRRVVDNPSELTKRLSG
jgi:hypothetical protein